MACVLCWSVNIIQNFPCHAEQQWYQASCLFPAFKEVHGGFWFLVPHVRDLLVITHIPQKRERNKLNKLKINNSSCILPRTTSKPLLSKLVGQTGRNRESQLPRSRSQQIDLYNFSRKTLNCNWIAQGSLQTSLRVKNSKGGLSLHSLHQHPPPLHHILEFYFQELYQVLTIKIRENSPFLLLVGGRTEKQFWNISILPNNACPQQKLFCHSLTDCGFYQSLTDMGGGKYPTQAH